MNVLGIAGSLRQDSLNAALLRAAVELAPKEMTLEVGSIRGIPLYDGDVEAREGVPTAIAGASPGRGGTKRAQTAWRPVLEALGCRVYGGGTLQLARAREAFDDELQLEGETAREELACFLAGFAAFVSAG